MNQYSDHAGTKFAPTPATNPLPIGVELRRLRRCRGLSQKAMATLLGLSAHSAVADYENGKRLPHNDIIISYERVFGLPHGTLQTLRWQALAAIAEAELRRHWIPTTLPAPGWGVHAVVADRAEGGGHEGTPL